MDSLSELHRACYTQISQGCCARDDGNGNTFERLIVNATGGSERTAQR